MTLKLFSALNFIAECCP